MRGSKRDSRLITLCFAVVLIPFLSIYRIRSSVSPVFYQAWQIGAVVVLFFIVAVSAKNIKVNWSTGLFLLYQTIILLSSFLNQGFSSGILVVTTAAVLLFTLLQSDYDTYIINAICGIVVVSALINLVFMLFNIKSTNGEFFIGGKNALSMFLVPGTFLLLLKSYNTNQKIEKKTLIIVLVFFLSIFIGASGTGIVVAFLSALFLIAAFKTRPRKAVYLLIILSCYILFLFFEEKFFYTEYWIKFTDFLGKDSTLTSRTTIWGLAKEIIRDHWFLGSGRGTVISYVNTWEERQSIYEAHNFILEILMEGGVLALSVFSALFYKAVSKLNMELLPNKIIFAALCILLVNGLTESTLNNFFVIIILGIACRMATENRSREIKQ